MALVSCSRFPILGLLGLAFAYSPAHAEQSLGEAVRQLDAEYLEAPEVATVDNSPKIIAGGGEEAGPPKPREISQGPVRVKVTYDDRTAEEGDTSVAPVVTVFVEDSEVAKLEGEALGFIDPPISVQIAEIDPANDHPEIVVSFFTGGAHCCSDTSVITHRVGMPKDEPQSGTPGGTAGDAASGAPDASDASDEASSDMTSDEPGGQASAAWQVVRLGQFDGGPMVAVDLDGEGRYEFETRDNAFLYAFACYACSEAPLQVLAIEDGAVKDVSSDQRFKPAHAAWLKTMIVGVPEEDVNGFLAGYVAQKTLLGEGKEAWKLMLAHYDQASDWGLEVCDQPLGEDGECPGETARLTFPEALERMLKENGYKIEK